MTLAWTGKASDVCCLLAPCAEEAYFSFHVLRELQNGVNPCPGIWVVLEVCEDFLSNSLLQNRQYLIRKTTSCIFCLTPPAVLKLNQKQMREIIIHFYMEHKIIRAVRVIGLTSKLQACNGDGAALTWDPISWYMELTTLSNRLMSSFWLKSKSCLAGWSANMVIAAGRGLLGEVKWRQTSQQQQQKKQQLLTFKMVLFWRSLAFKSHPILGK